MMDALKCRPIICVICQGPQFCLSASRSLRRLIPKSKSRENAVYRCKAIVVNKPYRKNTLYQKVLASFTQPPSIFETVLFGHFSPADWRHFPVLPCRLETFPCFPLQTRDISLFSLADSRHFPVFPCRLETFLCFPLQTRDISLFSLAVSRHFPVFLCRLKTFPCFLLQTQDISLLILSFCKVSSFDPPPYLLTTGINNRPILGFAVAAKIAAEGKKSAKWQWWS